MSPGSSSTPTSSTAQDRHRLPSRMSALRLDDVLSPHPTPSSAVEQPELQMGPSSAGSEHLRSAPLASTPHRISVGENVSLKRCTSGMTDESSALEDRPDEYSVQETPSTMQTSISSITAPQTNVSDGFTTSATLESDPDPPLSRRKSAKGKAPSTGAGAICTDDENDPVLHLRPQSTPVSRPRETEDPEPVPNPALGGHPLVRGTLDAYARAKEKSRLVKYSAGWVETLSRPVLSRVGGVLGETNVQQFNGFARRQLDWLYPTCSSESFSRRESNLDETMIGPEGEALVQSLSSSLVPEEYKAIKLMIQEQLHTSWNHLSVQEQQAQVRQVWLYVLHTRRPDLACPASTAFRTAVKEKRGKGPSNMPSFGQELPPLNKGKSTDPHSPYSGNLKAGQGQSSQFPGLPAMSETRVGERPTLPPLSSTIPRTGNSSSHNQLPSRISGHQRELAAAAVLGRANGLQRMLTDAGVSGGRVSGALASRPETLKSLQYCLKWLQYGTAHLEHHLTSVRDVMVQINHGEVSTPSVSMEQALALAPCAAPPQLAVSLVQIKHEVVGTIRSVVNVVSTYAGAALPSSARNFVKGSLLSLPARWTSITSAQSGASSAGQPGSVAGAATGQTAGACDSGGAMDGGQEIHSAAMTANQVFVLAVESLDILRNVAVVFGESLDKVDLWMNRICAVGLQRKRALEDALREGNSVAGMDRKTDGPTTRLPMASSPTASTSSKPLPSTSSSASISTFTPGDPGILSRSRISGYSPHTRRRFSVQAHARSAHVHTLPPLFGSSAVNTPEAPAAPSPEEGSWVRRQSPENTNLYHLESPGSKRRRTLPSLASDYESANDARQHGHGRIGAQGSTPTRGNSPRRGNSPSMRPSYSSHSSHPYPSERRWSSQGSALSGTIRSRSIRSPESGASTPTPTFTSPSHHTVPSSTFHWPHQVHQAPPFAQPFSGPGTPTKPPSLMSAPMTPTSSDQSLAKTPTSPHTVPSSILSSPGARAPAMNMNTIPTSATLLRKRPSGSSRLSMSGRSMPSVLENAEDKIEIPIDTEMGREMTTEQGSPEGAQTPS